MTKFSTVREMFYGAKPEIFERARVLRENMTAAEKTLWSKLKMNQLGFRFKSQHPIDIFIVDFYCHQLKLVIEVDGGYHKGNFELDESRTNELNELGLDVIRFTNDEVISNTEKVVLQIMNWIEMRDASL